MTSVRIFGGRVIDPANSVDQIGDVCITDGKICAIGEAPSGFHADHEINASGKIVCPGLVDLHARLREPGQEHKGTIASETRAAAASGITTLCCPPDTDPVLDTPAVAKLIRQRTADSGLARTLPIGALTKGLTGEQLSEMQALRAAGCIAVGNARHPITSTLVLRRALEYAGTLGLTVFLTPKTRG